MTFAIVRDIVAQEDMAAFAQCAADYSEDFARGQFACFDRLLAAELAKPAVMASAAKPAPP